MVDDRAEQPRTQIGVSVEQELLQIHVPNVPSGPRPVSRRTV
jgi:hypothetical protein